MVQTKHGESHEEKRTKKPRGILWIILGSGLMLLFVILTVIYWHQTNPLEPKNYLLEEFSEGLSFYQGTDAFWVRKESGDDGYVKLSRQNYFTPYLSIPLSLSEAPEGSFVAEMSIKVNRFTDEAVVLGSFYFAAWEISLVVNDEGKIGLAQNLFQKPQYSESFFGELAKGKWQELGAHFDIEANEINVFLEGRKMISLKLSGDIYPLHEIGLGAAWLKGGGNYGSPLDIEYDSLRLANEGVLPRPSIIEFYRKLLTD